jgi:bifunctional UDP-N-acetylglucosamine pyrophosphorylase/glucosamine-1-phosphate N-acetyltransferase
VAPTLVLVLAAGEGTRMRSSLAKVLHEANGRTLVGHVLAATQPLEAVTTCVVVGHQRERVVEWLSAEHPSVLTAVQDEQHGTGHAVRVALAQLDDQQVDLTAGTVMVLTADTPLLTSETLEALQLQHAQTGAAATVLTAVIDDATGYGRILRADNGDVLGIVEHKDATEEQRAIGEFNSAIYVFDLPILRDALTRLTTDNAQGEEYLTDVLAIMRGDGHRVAASTVADADEVMGVNDRAQLALASRLLRDRYSVFWMRAGVTIIDPDTTWIEAGVTIGRDAVIEPNTQLKGGTTIAEGAHIGPDTTLTDCDVQAGAVVTRTHATQAVIWPRATVGPYTYLRPGTVLGERAKAGAYVEMKNASVGRGSKVPHLSYVGDAEIGEDSNIGAATIFVNYDGVDKHRTVVGSGVRIGSDSMLIAPVTIGDGAYTAAGSVITSDVPAGSLAVARATMRIIEKWVLRRRAGTNSATLAQAALDLNGDNA